MLRMLEEKDAPLMLEWMHDEEVLRGLQASLFRTKTIEDCINFIRSAQDQGESCHMAIVDEDDNYLGTISLKMIDHNYKDAEFSIVLRQQAWGKGVARQAMNDIFEIAFERYGLNQVYWNVLANNHRAIRSYIGGGYKELTDVSDRRRKRGPKNENGEFEEVKFFCVTK